MNVEKHNPNNAISLDAVAQVGAFETDNYTLEEPSISLEKQLDVVFEYGRRYRAAAEANDEDGITEWKDELEVLALHSEFPSIQGLCALLVDTTLIGAN